MSEIAILGAGAWGTALSIVLGRKDLGRKDKDMHRIRLWAHEPEICDAIAWHRVNEKFLPGQTIPPCVTPHHNLAETIEGASILISAMPSQHCRRVFEQLQPHLRAETMFVSATKGLEENSMLRMTEVIAQVAKSDRIPTPRIGALSGPSFALEAARGDPTAIAIASHDKDLALSIQREFSHVSFRVYTNGDPIGVELGGALKNIIAIAAGICAGLGLGHNSIAALITRGLAEMTRLVVACGGKAETMAGLAGLGDLVLTCTGGLSRNRGVGVELGRGRKLPEILAQMHGAVAEGVFTTTAAVGLARARGVDMPITEQMYAILHEGKAPRDAIHELMTRRSKSETLTI
jgi:glycerol-3-phosphate dehydrogenase (NAD(P)+)